MWVSAHGIAGGGDAGGSPCGRRVLGVARGVALGPALLRKTRGRVRGWRYHCSTVRDSTLASHVAPVRPASPFCRGAFAASAPSWRQRCSHFAVENFGYALSCAASTSVLYVRHTRPPARARMPPRWLGPGRSWTGRWPAAWSLQGGRGVGVGAAWQWVKRQASAKANEAA